MTPFVLRRARPEDGDTIRAIVFDTLLAFGVGADPGGLDRDVMSFGRSAPPVIEFVAECDGAVVGSVIVTPRTDGSALLSKFFVGESERGRGIGRALLRAAVEAARDTGLHELELDTRVVFHAAIHLYEATGWRSVPRTTNKVPCELFYVLDLRR